MASGLQHRVSSFLLFLIAIAVLGPLQFGLHLAELNAPQDVITCEHKLSTNSPSTLARLLSLAKTTTTAPSEPDDCIPMTPAAFATISAILTVGAFLGALAAGPLASARGRLVAMRMTALFFLLGSAIDAFASSVPLLALGRLLNGVGGGGATVIVPLYVSEVSPPSARGFFGAATQVGINIGILGTQTMGYFWSHGSAWRWVLGSGAVVALVHGFGLVLIPESPAWAGAIKGDAQGARRILQRIRGRGVDVDEEVRAWGARVGVAAPTEEEALLAGGETGEVAAPSSLRSVTKEEEAHVGFLQVATDPFYRPAIIAVVGIMFAQQLCGINSIIMYSVSLLSDVLPINSSLMTIIISLVNLIATMSFSPLPDKLGRKTCLLISIAGQGSSSLALAFSILFGVKLLSALSVLLFVASFGVGLGPVGFILASELVGPEAVGATQSWGLAANYLATFLVAQFFPILNEALNARLGGAGWCFFLFAGFAALFGAFVQWRVPETLGRKDADEVWGRTRRID